MKLYTANISPFAAMCRIQIYSKGLDIELLELPHDATWDDVKAVSPLGRIPVLVDGELVLPESQVIAEYLEDTFPELPLRPDTAEQLARMRLLCRISDHYIMGPITVLFAHLSRKHRDQKVVDEQLTAINTGLASLDFFLAESGYAVGEQMTLADCTLVPIFVFAEKYLPFFAMDNPWADYNNVSRYWDEVRQNAVVAKVVDEVRQGIEAKVAQAKAAKKPASQVL